MPESIGSKLQWIVPRCPRCGSVLITNRRNSTVAARCAEGCDLTADDLIFSADIYNAEIRAIYDDDKARQLRGVKP